MIYFIFGVGLFVFFLTVYGTVVAGGLMFDQGADRNEPRVRTQGQQRWIGAERLGHRRGSREVLNRTIPRMTPDTDREHRTMSFRRNRTQWNEWTTTVRIDSKVET